MASLRKDIITKIPQQRFGPRFVISVRFITRLLRHNVIPNRGINVITLPMTATTRGYAFPIWLTYKQAREFVAQVRKGERHYLRAKRYRRWTCSA
jgi:antirestriction protein ArdC